MKHRNLTMAVLTLVVASLAPAACSAGGTSKRTRTVSAGRPQGAISGNYADCAVGRDYVPKEYRLDREFILASDEVDVLAPVWWGGNIYEGVALYDQCLQRFSRQQRLMWAVLWYEAEVSNGGHDQFY